MKKKKRICYVVVVVVVGSWNFHDILHQKLEILKGGGGEEWRGTASEVVSHILAYIIQLKDKQHSYKTLNFTRIP